MYQYSSIAPRLSGQISIFGVVFFVSKSLLGIERLKKSLGAMLVNMAYSQKLFYAIHEVEQE